jgi:hypothetical protein
MLHDFGLGGMDAKAGSSALYHLANSSDVVYMCMGNDNEADLEIKFTNIAKDSGCVPRWIDNHAIPSLLRRNEVAVRSKGHYLQGSIDHFCHWESPRVLTNILQAI